MLPDGWLLLAALLAGGAALAAVAASLAALASCLATSRVAFSAWVTRAERQLCRVCRRFLESMWFKGGPPPLYSRRKLSAQCRQ